MKPIDTVRFTTWLFTQAYNLPGYKGRLISLAKDVLKGEMRDRVLNLLEILPVTTRKVTDDDLIESLSGFGDLMGNAGTVQIFEALAAFEKGIYHDYCELAGDDPNAHPHDELLYGRLAEGYLRDQAARMFNVDPAGFGGTMTEQLLGKSLKALKPVIAQAFVDRTFFTENYADKRMRFDGTGCKLVDVAQDEWDDVVES